MKHFSKVKLREAEEQNNGRDLIDVSELELGSDSEETDKRIAGYRAIYRDPS